MSVDGSELTGADHATAVDILRNTMGVSITLTVERRIYRLSPAVDSQVPGGDGRHHLDSEESESITSDSHHQQHQLNQSNSLSSPQRVVRNFDFIVSKFHQFGSEISKINFSPCFKSLKWDWFCIYSSAVFGGGLVNYDSVF